jgi:hypothetical protein
LFPQCGQRSSQEARDVHLGDPEPFGDLSLGHVLEESKQEHGSLTFGRRRHQRADRFDIEHPVQIGV